MSKIKNALKYVNSLPFPFTMKHYFALGDDNSRLKDNELNSPEAWDALRQNHSHFSISENREEWLKASEGLIKKDGQDGAFKQRAQDVIKVIDQLRVTSLFSVGSGGAGLEYQIKKMRPNIRVTCSEYSPVAVTLLYKVFLEADSIIQFDMKSKEWSEALKETTPQKQLCLLYRIDINFTDKELKDIIKNMFDSEIQNILFISCGCITFRGVFNRLKQRLIWKMSSTSYIFAGYLRTKKTFESFWHSLYTATEFDSAGLPSFLLTRIGK